MYFVTIEGTDYGVHYGFTVCHKHMKKAGIKSYNDLGFLPEKLPMKTLPEFVKDGLDCYADLHKKDRPFHEDEVNDLLEKHLYLAPKFFEVFAKCVIGPVDKIEVPEKGAAPVSKKGKEDKQTEGN